MQIPQFTRKQVESLLENVNDLYDITRLVDPSEHEVLEMGGEEGGCGGDGCCYDVWGRPQACQYCSSYRAARSGHVQDKTEVLGDDVYHIVSIPVRVDEDGKMRSCTIELVKKMGQVDSDPDDALPAMEPENYMGMEFDRKMTMHLLHAAAQKSRIGFMCFDNHSHLISANQTSFMLFRVQNDAAQLEAIFRTWLFSEHSERSGSVWNQFFNYQGHEYLYEVQYYQVHDEDGTVMGSLYSVYDTTALTENMPSGYLKSIHDPMTGTYNREGFYAKARETLAKDWQHDWLLIESNIRDFKLVNQLFGINKGNEILMALADALRSQCREKDIHGRIHGDHCVLLIRKDHFSEESLLKAGRHVSDLIQSSIYQVRIQFGIYEIEEHAEDISLMCDRAGLALASIREDQVCSLAWYSSQMMKNVLYESEVISSFREAIEKKQIRIYLQPQNDYEGNLLAAEALARWVHPEMGIIPPGRFIGVLERANLIHELDRYIWELAAKQLSEFKGTDKEDLKISVNISPKDIYYLDVLSVFDDLIRRYDIAPDHLNLEITESAVISNPEKCAALVADLQSRGFLVEIDDFGSGYSSLNLLKDINADVLKIDMGFLQRANVRAEIILGHIIEMARDLHMKVITEGVETKAQLDMLHDLGCNMYQGFYFSRPVPVEDFLGMYYHA